MNLEALRGRAIAVCLALAVASPVVAAPDPGPELRTLLDRFDAVQASVRTLSADFEWKTVSPLLREPMVSEGRLYLTKPDSIRWEFTSPEAMSFVIAHDEYVGYFPERKRAERHDFHRWSERLFRYFGIGQGSEELEKVYDIRLGDPAEALPGTRLLVLEPRKRRARKRIEDLKIWIDATTYLPVRIVSRTTDGGSRELDFSHVEVNPSFGTGLYTINLPPDVKVEQGTGGLGGMFQLAPGSAD